MAEKRYRMTKSSGSVDQICISAAKGTPKESRPWARFVEDFGIEGDAHASKETHRQVSLLATEAIKTVKDKGLNLEPGAFGENVCLSGIDLGSIKTGAVLRLGEGVKLLVTQIGKECHTRCSIYHRAGFCIMPTKGVFAKVICGGIVKEGDGAEVLSSPSAK